MQIIPLTNYPDQTFKITLEGTPMDCRVYWCDYDSTCKEIIGDVDGQWRMDFAIEGFEVHGMALVAGCDLLEPLALDELGGMWLEADANREELGGLYRLLYIDRSEVDTYSRAIGYRR